VNPVVNKTLDVVRKHQIVGDVLPLMNPPFNRTRINTSVVWRYRADHPLACLASVTKVVAASRIVGRITPRHLIARKVSLAIIASFQIANNITLPSGIRSSRLLSIAINLHASPHAREYQGKRLPTMSSRRDGNETDVLSTQR